MTESQIILYATPDGDIKVDTVLQNETIWLTQNAMAELFGVNVPAISKHLANIYEEGELSREATVSKTETVAIDYDKSSEQAQLFFKKIQNKMLWSITGKTAAELIESRSGPQGRPLLSFQFCREQHNTGAVRLQIGSASGGSCKFGDSTGTRLLGRGNCPTGFCVKGVAG